VFTHVDANGHLIIIAVYIDDFFFISKSLKFVESSKPEMSGHFKMKDLGPAKWILQMELNHDISNGVITLSQSQYIEEILKCHGMADSQPVKTPMDVIGRLNTNNFIFLFFYFSDFILILYSYFFYFSFG